MKGNQRTVAAIAAAAGIAIIGLLARGMIPELVRYLRIRRM